MTIDSAIFHHGTQGGWIKCAENPVLGGDLGVCFDICCLKEEGLVRMYFSWRTRQCIAVAVSRDGLHFDAPEICIQPRETAQGWEDGLNRPAVVKRGNVYHMWYTGQFKRGAADGTSHIFHAVSQDGVHFERTGDLPVLAPEAVWEKQAVMCPAVLWDEEKGLYRMWYSGGEQYEPNAIGYASLAAIKDTVKALSVNGVAPSEATVSDGSYEVQRPFVLVTKEGVELSKAAQLFFDYATGKDAADIISAAGAVPVAK